jgi:putative phosphoribosyl transferase
MAFDRLPGPKSLSVIPGAGHLFSEPGALKEVIAHAASWFECYLSGKRESGDWR